MNFQKSSVITWNYVCFNYQNLQQDLAGTFPNMSSFAINAHKVRNTKLGEVVIIKYLISHLVIHNSDILIYCIHSQL